MDKGGLQGDFRGVLGCNLHAPFAPSARGSLDGFPSRTNNDDEDDFPGGLMNRKVSQLGLLLILVLIFDRDSSAQGLEYVKANYTKQEHTIPMRDGVRLFTAVYAPKDQSTTYPIL